MIHAVTMAEVDDRHVALARREARQLFQDLGDDRVKRFTNRLAQFKRDGWQLVWAVEAFVAPSQSHIPISFMTFVDAVLQVYTDPHHAWFSEICQSSSQMSANALGVLLGVAPHPFWCPNENRLEVNYDNAKALNYLFDMLDTMFFTYVSDIMAVFVHSIVNYHKLLVNILRRRIRSAMQPSCDMPIAIG